jgi:hypothetical protein
MNTRTLSWMAAVNKKCHNLFFNVIRYLKPFLLCWYWEIVVLSKVFGNFPFLKKNPHLSTLSAASVYLECRICLPRVPHLSTSSAASVYLKCRICLPRVPHLSTSSAPFVLLAKLSRLSIDSRLVFYPSVFKSFPTPCCTLSHEGTTLPPQMFSGDTLSLVSLFPFYPNHTTGYGCSLER